MAGKTLKGNQLLSAWRCLEDVMHEYDVLAEDECMPDVHDSIRRGERFLLVERNHRGHHWLTVHPLFSAAADYHLSQECANEWEVLMLVDLYSGKRWTAEVELRWQVAS